MAEQSEKKLFRSDHELKDYIRTSQASSWFTEEPTGRIDGMNKTFNTKNHFYQDSLAVFLNGARQRPGKDFRVTDSRTFVFNTAPPIGQAIVVDYVLSKGI